MENKNAYRVVLAVCFFALIFISEAGLAKAFEENTTRAEALESILNGSRMINEMAENNFSIAYVNDSLMEAKLVLEQADYAEILRDTSIQSKDKAEAEEALRLVNWKNITYGSVIPYINEIAETSKRAFFVSDLINAAEKDIESYEEKGINASEERHMLDTAREELHDGRYDEAINLTKNIVPSLENREAELSSANAFKLATRGFIEKYWREMIAIAVILVLVGLVIYRVARKTLLKKKIEKLKAEKEAIVSLIKEAQRERYIIGNLAEEVYKIRIRKYEEKLNGIKRMLPVLNSRLKKMS